MIFSGPSATNARSVHQMCDSATTDDMLCRTVVSRNTEGFDASRTYIYTHRHNIDTQKCTHSRFATERQTRKSKMDERAQGSRGCADMVEQPRPPSFVFSLHIPFSPLLLHSILFSLLWQIRYHVNPAKSPSHRGSQSPDDSSYPIVIPVSVGDHSLSLSLLRASQRLNGLKRHTDTRCTE